MTDIDAIRARLAAATPAPWGHEASHYLAVIDGDASRIQDGAP